jgi:hypothetical protein
MSFELEALLPVLIPKAITWAEAHCDHISQIGQPLSEVMLAVAKSVGVRCPEQIRIVEVPSLPLPEDPELQQAALATGMLGSRMHGLTLGYGVYVCVGRWDIRLLSHEFRHVYQYEQAGSIAAFLPAYLQQIVTVGYANSPFEIDARMHERFGL